MCFCMHKIALQTKSLLEKIRNYCMRCKFKLLHCWPQHVILIHLSFQRSAFNCPSLQANNCVHLLFCGFLRQPALLNNSQVFAAVASLTGRLINFLCSWENPRERRKSKMLDLIQNGGFNSKWWIQFKMEESIQNEEINSK